MSSEASRAACDNGEAASKDEARIVPLRLQKFLARAGVASRRGSEDLMTAGRVRVNGVVVTELGTKVDPRVDVVDVDGVMVSPTAQPVTLLLNKPTDCVTTMSDPQHRRCVADLVPVDIHPGLFPIGRLDRDTTGLLLFSTDGELGNALLHPRHHVTKTYLAQVQGVPDDEALEHLRNGVLLEDGMTAPAKAGIDGSTADGAVVRLSIHEGKKRQVRRMLDALGYPVVALHRCSFGPIELDDTPEGQWRMLDDHELSRLYEAASAQKPHA